jgi:hypothetical protein
MLRFRGEIRRNAGGRRLRIRKRRGEGRNGMVRVLFLGDKLVTECVFIFRDAYGPSFKCLVGKLNPRDVLSRGFNLTGLFASVACLLCCTNSCHIVFF